MADQIPIPRLDLIVGEVLAHVCGSCGHVMNVHRPKLHGDEILMPCEHDHCVIMNEPGCHSFWHTRDRNDEMAERNRRELLLRMGLDDEEYYLTPEDDRG